MNYYPFHIGDYAAHTQRLSPMEDLAYRRMIDAYYLAERPFIGCSADVAREIGMLDHIEAVEYVLEKFFDKTEEGFANARCDEEIARYRDKQAKASSAGKASAERRLKKKPTDVQKNPTDEQLTKNQEPITNNHKPVNQKHNATPVESGDSTPVDPVERVEKFDFAKALHASGVSDLHIAEWLKVRKAKRCVSTRTAFESFVKNVSGSGMTLDAAVELCIARSWAGFDPDWLKPKQTGQPYQPYESVKDRRRRETIEVLTGKRNATDNIIDISAGTFELD